MGNQCSFSSLPLVACGPSPSWPDHFVLSSSRHFEGASRSYQPLLSPRSEQYAGLYAFKFTQVHLSLRTQHDISRNINIHRGPYVTGDLERKLLISQIFNHYYLSQIGLAAVILQGNCFLLLIQQTDFIYLERFSRRVYFILVSIRLLAFHYNL